MESGPGNSPAVARFQSCRWREAEDEGVSEHCGHRDVLPMAGAAGFSAESWCTDCAFYKARRITRKREEPTPPPPPQDDWRFRY